MSHTLLLADDSLTIQRVIALTFAGENVRVVAVGDGQQAIDRLSADPPDIVLADIGMPRRSGYDVAAFVKAQPALAGIPVLLLTGAFEELDESRVKASGADGVLVKPFEPRAVIGRVRELLGIGRSARTPDSAPGRVTPEDFGPRPADAQRVVPASAVPQSDGQAHWPALAAPATTWEELREQSGLGANAASVESPQSSGDAYFDSLDSAFDSLDSRLAHQGPVLEEAAGTPSPGPGRDADSVFEVRDEWFGSEGEEAPIEAAPQNADASPLAASATFATSPRTSVADAFEALLADEQGEPPAPIGSAAPGTEGFVDAVAARVAARLAVDGLSPALRAIVIETTERLVREEIRRIRDEAERRY